MAGEMHYIRGCTGKDRELNNLHKPVGWARKPVPYRRARRDAHPTRKSRIAGYLILIPKPLLLIHSLARSWRSGHPILNEFAAKRDRLAYE